MIEAIQNITNDLPFYFQQYADRYAFLFPLGLIGLWRWSVWMMKEVVGSNYKPKKEFYRAAVTVVTPVYNEDPDVFTAALASWKKNKPNEIIAVIDHTDSRCIKIFKEFSKTFEGATLIITKKPGKRPALADGILKSKSEIIALVDSDTIWAEDVIRNGLPPFHDKKVAGVATYQSVLRPKSFAQKIFDVQLDLRYMHEYPFLAAAGDALVCLSGRTAFYRKSVIVPMVPELNNETFMGRPVISGDDKCLTYLVLAAGWKVAYQSNCRVYTPGMNDLGSYLKQRLRWSRNSLRADLKAILSGWPLRHPALFFFQIDKILQSFVVILSPIFFFIALSFEQWVAATVILCWWFISRTVKMYSHLFQKPQHISIIPGYILFSFYSGLVKIYALFTLNTQGWITRWDKTRMPQLQFLNAVPAFAATAGVVLVLIYGVYQYKQHTYFIPLAKRNAIIMAALPKLTGALALNKSVLGASTQVDKQLLTQKYVSTEIDTLESIATQFGIESQNLYAANSAKLLIPGYIPPGTTLTIPGKDTVLDPLKNFEYGVAEDNPLLMRYDVAANTIVITGRGQRVTLSRIRDWMGSQYLEETAPTEWHAKASIYLYHGVTLELDKKEVTWLKFESSPKGFTTLRAMSGDILVNGVKITSWDSEKKDFDTNMDDGRSFIMVKDNSRMDFNNAELAYLGYPTSKELSVSPYGISWKLSSLKLLSVMLTGEVVNSKFHHNYFGSYTYGATGMLWRGNEFYDNVRYGLDPHDDSNGFLVENNYAYNNGTHGIIFSKRCVYNTIRNNISVDNGLHGIMLHEKSDFNIIEGNTVSGNVSGVALWRSSNNIVRNNTIKNNKHGIRANVSSNNNVMEHNEIMDSQRYGFYLYDEANNNVIRKNIAHNNEVGIYIKSDSNEVSTNVLKENGIGIYFLDSASNNTAENNTIDQSSVYAIYTKIDRSLQNALGTNILHNNRKNIEGQEATEDLEP